jgi:hypothetical protein
MTLPVFGNCRRAVGERHDTPALQQPDQAGRMFFDSWPFTGHVGKFDVRTFWRVIATRPRHRRIPRPRQ